MKKLLAAAALTLLGTGAFAQTSQGTVVVAGGVGFSTATSENDLDDRKPRNTSFSIAPSIGYMLQEGLEVGVQLHYSHSRYKKHHYYYDGNNNYTSLSTTDAYGIAPYLKKYFMLTEKVALTGEASVGFNVRRTESEATNDTGSFSDYSLKSSGFGVGLTPGFTFFPTEKIGLSATFGRFGYTQNTTKHDDNKNTSSDFGFNFNSSTSMVSFSYFISR